MIKKISKQPICASCGCPVTLASNIMDPRGKYSLCSTCYYRISSDIMVQSEASVTLSNLFRDYIITILTGRAPFSATLIEAIAVKYALEREDQQDFKEVSND